MRSDLLTFYTQLLTLLLKTQIPLGIVALEVVFSQRGR